MNSITRYLSTVFLAVAVVLGASVAVGSNFPSSGSAFGSLAANILGGALLLQGATATNYIESNNGATAPVSGAATGRFRYNDSTGLWEQSVQTGAYAPVSTVSLYRESVSVYKSSNQTLGTVTLTAITFDTELFKRGDPSSHDNVTNNSRLYARVAGVYLVQGLILCGSSGGTQEFQLETKINGTTYAGEVQVTTALSTTTSPSISQVLVLAANDYVELLGEGTLFSVDAQGGDRSFTWFSLTLLAGQ